MRFLKTGLFLVIGTMATTLSAQDVPRTVVGSAGTYFSDLNTGNLHWTVGEVAVDFTVNSIVLAQGFHQGYYDLVVTSIWESTELNVDLKVYPNPTAGQLIVEGNWDRGDRLRISDLLGRPLIDTELSPNRMDFELGTYPAGTYLISFQRDGRLLKTFQVIKQ